MSISPTEKLENTLAQINDTGWDKTSIQYQAATNAAWQSYWHDEQERVNEALMEVSEG